MFIEGRAGNVGAEGKEEVGATEGKIYTVVAAGVLVATWELAEVAGTELAGGCGQ